jgi:hypothetical protein
MSLLQTCVQLTATTYAARADGYDEINAVLHGS